MALPPTPEGFAGGLANPTGGQGGRRGQRNSPSIGVDPGTVSMLGRVKESIRGLKTEMKGLADQAERYARAMGQKASGWGSGGRPANMPEPMRRQDERQALGRRVATGGGMGGGARPAGQGVLGGSLGTGEELLLAAPLIQQGFQRLFAQIGNLVQRERITSRIAMLQPGAYGGAEQAGSWQRLGRSATGYANTSDLYGGMRELSRLGLLRRPNDQQSQRAVREAGQLAILGGTTYTGGAQAMAGFASPQSVMAMRQWGINPTPGGKMQMLGQQGLMEQMFQRFGGEGRGEDFWRTGLRPGTGLHHMLQQAGFGEEQMEMLQMYGVSRAEVGPGGRRRGADEVEKDLRKRYKDTGENLRELQEAFSELRDNLATALIPMIKAFSAAIGPPVRLIGKLFEKVPGLTYALGAATAALLTFITMTKLATAAQKAGAVMGGMTGLGGLGRTVGGLGGLLGKAAAPLGMAVGGYVLGEGGQSLISGGQTEGGRATAGRVFGGAATGAGIGAAVGSVFPVVGTAVGAGVGAVLGGAAGLFGIGDAWPAWMRDDVGDSDVTPKEPTPPVASGRDLPGAKAGDQNMNPEFVKRLQQMFADNPQLTLTSGWRDSAEQARLFREKPHLAAPPGKSNHERGTAADLGPQSQWAWIGANLHKYGLFLPMPPTAERKAKGKKIEPWHVEPVGLTGSVPVQAMTGSSSEPSSAGRSAKARAKSPETALGGGGASTRPGGGYSEAGRISSLVGGTQIGDAWEGVGDNEVTYVGTQVSPMGRGKGGGDIHIGRIEIKLSIARGTYEEAERTARYLGQILGDRTRLLELARTGTP